MKAEKAGGKTIGAKRAILFDRVRLFKAVFLALTFKFFSAKGGCLN